MKKDNNVFIDNQTNIPNNNHNKDNENISGNNKNNYLYTIYPKEHECYLNIKLVIRKLPENN